MKVIKKHFHDEGVGYEVDVKVLWEPMEGIRYEIGKVINDSEMEVKLTEEQEKLFWERVL